MKIRRWFVLLFICVFLAGGALAEAPDLDEIGVRYTATEAERIVTRTDLNDQALTALGVDSDTLLSSMERDGVYLLSLTADGQQLSLRVTEKPSGIAAQNAYEMTAAEKDMFLAALAREGNFATAAWQEELPNYALFASTPDAQGAQLSYSTVALSTLYLGRVLTLGTDVIGREPSQSDTELLLQAARNTLLLGAKVTREGEAEPQELVLPSLPTLSEQSAPITYSNPAFSLTVEPIAAIVGTTSVTLAGQTEPSASLRYSVGGKASSRVKAAEDGSFSLTVPNLTENAQNLIELTAFNGDEKNIASMTVTVDWQSTPIVLEKCVSTTESSITLKGLTLAGASVSLTKGRGTGKIVVAQDGSFSVTLNLGKGENAFSIRSLLDGYRRTDYAFSVLRTDSEEAALQALQKKAKVYEYDRLQARPSLYVDKTTLLTGTASRLTWNDGVASFTLTNDDGAYRVLCDNLLSIHEGEALSLIGTLSGAWDVGALPELTLAALLS